MKNVLVIGGTGIIGRPLTNSLSRAGFRVLSVALDETKDTPSNVEQIVIDRFSNEFQSKVLAILGPNECLEATIDVCAYSAESSKTLIAALQNKCNHFITISTTLVYDREQPHLAPITEETPMVKTGLYGGYVDNKVELEHFLQNSKEINWTIFRPYHILGKHSLLGCIPAHNRDKNLVKTIKSTGKISLCKGGEIPLNYIHPNDIAMAIKLAVSNPQAHKHAFNLVNPKVVYAKDYYLEIARQLGVSLEIEEIDLRKYWQEKIGWEMTTLPHIYDSSKLKNILGFTPNTELSQGISDALENPPVITTRSKHKTISERMNKEPLPTPPSWLFS